MYEIYCKLRDAKKCKDADVAKATGITKSTFSDWKSGRSKPKGEKLRKIADYFGVSVEYLTNGEDSSETYYINEDTAKVAQKIFENKDLRMLFDAVEDATPQDLLALHGMALALKRKERGNIDDTGC
jgi:transcriptional regulator with XRE-family HTH domain